MKIIWEIKYAIYIQAGVYTSLKNQKYISLIKKYLETLDRMRKGGCTEEDVKLLRSRCITKMSKNFPRDACNLFYTNKEVEGYNAQKLNAMKSKLYSINYMGDFPKGYRPKISNYGTVDETNLYQNLKLKIFKTNLHLAISLEAIKSLLMIWWWWL